MLWTDATHYHVRLQCTETNLFDTSKTGPCISFPLDSEKWDLKGYCKNCGWVYEFRLTDKGQKRRAQPSHVIEDRLLSLEQTQSKILACLADFSKHIAQLPNIPCDNDAS